jgi:hypothetical protein
MTDDTEGVVTGKSLIGQHAMTATTCFSSLVSNFSVSILYATRHGGIINIDEISMRDCGLVVPGSSEVNYILAWF